MKKKLAVLALVVACAALGYVALTRESTQDASNPAPAFYTLKEDHFQVQFPHEPRHAETDMPFRSATEIVHYNSYASGDEDHTLYLLTTAVYPITPDPKEAGAHLQAFLKQLVSSSSNNAVVNEQAVVFQKNPALDFILLNNGVWTYGRAILAGSSLFVLLSSNTNNYLAEKNFHAFANSLEIK
jgi:hypothetical protein